MRRWKGQQHTIKLGRWALAISIGVAASLTLAITVLASQGNAAPVRIPSKQQVLQQMLSAQATADAKQPHIAKHPEAQPSPPTSCPGPVPYTGIVRGDGGRFKQDHIVNSVAVVPIEPVPYYALTFAGARGSNPQQGLIIVVREPKDPCLPNASFNQWLYYDTPYQQGALTLTGVSGDTVAFTTAAGGSGHFDVVTAKFI